MDLAFEFPTRNIYERIVLKWFKITTLHTEPVFCNIFQILNETSTKVEHHFYMCSQVPRSTAVDLWRLQLQRVQYPKYAYVPKCKFQNVVSILSEVALGISTTW